MISFWVLLVYLMADVMGMVHGGGGGGGGTEPGINHLVVAVFVPVTINRIKIIVPRKKTRGKAKNLKLDAELRRTGQPLTLAIDTECTFHPIGKPCDYFTSEVGIYMWRNIPLDRLGWKNVDQFEKTSLDVHLKAKFDLAQVEKDIHASKIKGGIQ
ncbi:hypothetical protein HanOQP8_Chr10g0372991 [Helianthus annuus]|nr:hypothetical protein HanOQP8_Chr10g0372991 [Helianthus annuus]